MDLSLSEENYLKAIYSLASRREDDRTSTNEIAEKVKLAPASVNAMLKNLHDKKLVVYARYKPVKLTSAGRKRALLIIRKHRLWELFLVKELQFSWDEVHEIAEQMEHIQSEKLIEKLDSFLGYPTHDPHGDPIPDSEGNVMPEFSNVLSSVKKSAHCEVVGVKDSSDVYLRYLRSTGIELGTKLQIIDKIEFDGSLKIKFGKTELNVSKKFADQLLIGCVKCKNRFSLCSHLR